MNEPAFGEDVVRALTRGRDYLRSGAVSRLERHGNRLNAEVEGSEYARMCRKRLCRKFVAGAQSADPPGTYAARISNCSGNDGAGL